MTTKEKAPIKGAPSDFSTVNIFNSAKVDKKSESANENENNSHTDSDIDSLMAEYNQQESNSQEQAPPSMFIVRSANDVVKDAMEMPRPEQLFLSLWYEGQFCIFFADSGNGKSLLAVQIANEIASTRKILYFDFELSDIQFSDRYSDNGLQYIFNDNFLRVGMNPEYIMTGGNIDMVAGMEQEMLRQECSVCIVDNITWLANSMEKSEEAGKLMMRLLRLKMVYGWSLMVIAHTPKREKLQPITNNDLAGSKVIFNLIDACFSLGKSVRGEDFRYLIQLKTRQRQFDYGPGNVILTQIVKEGCMVYHKLVGYSSEQMEITPPKEGNGHQELFNKIVGEKVMRYSEIVREITNECGCTDRTAKNWIKDAERERILRKKETGEYKLVKR